ncbi:hypothetical protein [Ramlibacter albus]|uniref:Uncharacterized protein n=1 Tax=Ramlibacter albus TaxID=2079448 RepID=A0A923MDP0_9BURK|nr:hypothetical protein [Ramlibacter albus]MBC5768453.1 hypothetical protein [Ramlibacter albus]
MPDAFSEPAQVRLAGVQTVAALAEREGWMDADEYAIKFAEALCSNGVSLDAQRERLAALVNVASATAGDELSAEELGKHYIILDALFRRLIVDAMNVAGDSRKLDASDKLLTGALKAQRAALACLSALKMIRESATLQPPVRPRSARALPAPDNGKQTDGE